jgi:hypothetical protein
MLTLLAALLLQTPAQEAKPAPAWTATTIEAANKDEHKAVLAAAKPATLTGEVIDLSCYLQLGKKGEGHKACGTKCVANGAPVGLLLADGRVVMLLAEQHHPRRDGQVTLAQAFSAKMAETVTVTGMLSKQAGQETLFIEAPWDPGARSMTGPSGRLGALKSGTQRTQKALRATQRTQRPPPEGRVPTGFTRREAPGAVCSPGNPGAGGSPRARAGCRLPLDFS